jgi:hypothetical protein
MRILIDTNIILDILLKRKSHFETTYSALRQAIISDDECLLSVSAITDIFCLLHKEPGDLTRARESLERILRLVNVTDVLVVDIQSELSDNLPDFEDAVVDAVAARSSADYILTRNIMDF